MHAYLGTGLEVLADKGRGWDRCFVFFQVFGRMKTARVFTVKEGMAARSARIISALSVIPDSSNNEKDNNQRRRSLGFRTQVRELQLKASTVKVNASQLGIIQPCYLACFNAIGTHSTEQAILPAMDMCRAPGYYRYCSCHAELITRRAITVMPIPLLGPLVIAYCFWVLTPKPLTTLPISVRLDCTNAKQGSGKGFGDLGLESFGRLRVQGFEI